MQLGQNQDEHFSHWNHFGTRIIGLLHFEHISPPMFFTPENPRGSAESSLDRPDSIIAERPFGIISS